MVSAVRELKERLKWVCLYGVVREDVFNIFAEIHWGKEGVMALRGMQG